MRSLFLLASLLLTTGVFAQVKHTYDYTTGNSYTTTTVGGTTTTMGTNLRTGSTWSQTNDSSGNYYGYDKSGNSYSGNLKTGTYSNSQGTTCSGTGLNRVCY